MCNLLYAAIDRIFVYLLPLGLFTYQTDFFWQHDSFRYFLLHLTRKCLRYSLLLFTGQPEYSTIQLSELQSTKLRGY